MTTHTRLLTVFMMFFLLVAAGCEKPDFDEEVKTEVDGEPDDDTINSFDENEDNGKDEDSNSESSEDTNDSPDDEDDESYLDGTPADEDTKFNGDTDIEDGNGAGSGYDTGDKLTVSEFIAAEELPGVFVTGYIVGACSNNISYADFTPPFDQPTAILLADNKNESDPLKVIAIQLKSGTAFRKAVNLVDNPKVFQRRLRVFGYRDTYLGITGIKNVGANNWELL